MDKDTCTYEQRIKQKVVLLKFLISKNDIEDLIIFTDNCPGQNKSSPKTLFSTHHFTVSGHTHLPSDSDFALIEKRHQRFILLKDGIKFLKRAITKRRFSSTL